MLLYHQKMSASKAKIVYGKRTSTTSLAPPTPSTEIKIGSSSVSATKKKIADDEEFARSLCTLSNPINASPSSESLSGDNHSNSDQEDTTVLNLSNCKRKHEMMELGSNSKFRDELDFMMQGLEGGNVSTVLSAMQEIRHKVQSDDDFGSRMRAMGAPQLIFDLLKTHFAKHDNVPRRQ